MILIADSGSTKTDWRIVTKDRTSVAFSTRGLNPFFVTDTVVVEVLKTDFPSVADKQKVSTVFFYGAGCSSADKSSIIVQGLQSFFPSASISVEHDLLGAARALCGSSKGIAAIIGTGSNSCLFDGRDIVQNVPSLGYILGDEASGSFFGRKLLTSYLRNEMPQSLAQRFEKEYSVSMKTVLNEVYRKSHSNKYLASFAPFLSANSEDSFIQSLLHSGFTLFFENHISRYPDYHQLPVSFLGSIAFVFQNILKEVADDFSCSLGKVIKTPIDELVAYHVNMPT